MINGDIKKIKIIRNCDWDYDQVILYMDLEGNDDTIEVPIRKPNGTGWKYAIKLCDNVMEICN